MEMSVVLTVLGVVGIAGSATWSSYDSVRERANAYGHAQVARQAVRAFVLQNKRLPCPDTSALGDGAREGTGTTCPSGTQVGWLPYESLGLPRPDRSARMRYAVSRNNVDLVNPPDLPAVGPQFDGVARIRHALADAAQQPTSSTRPFITGPDTSAGPADCGSPASNPAYALIVPVDDRDGLGAPYAGFDGINQLMAANENLCIAAPGRAMDAAYDDVVVIESASALLGWLASTTR